MSSTNSYTAWSFGLNGDLLGAAGNSAPQSFSFHSGTQNVPAGWSDSVAIQLANAIATAFTDAGFTNVSCTVQKDVYTDVTYTESNGQLV